MMDTKKRTKRKEKDKKSLEAAGTDQQSITSIRTVNIIGNASISGIKNHRNEVKDEQESSSPKRSRLEDLDIFDQSVAFTQSGGTMNYSGPGASSGIVHNQQNTTNNYYSNNEGNSSSQTSQPVDIDKLDCTDLKTYYSTTLCTASPLPWCHWYTWDIKEVYTELALQDSPTSKFGVKKLFEQWRKDNRKGSYRILIEGDAGYGKSTLMLKMASDWSESDSKDYISRFSLLFVVKLGLVGEDKKLLSYMQEFYKEQIDTPLKNVMKSKEAEKVLVLLDGYDEANAKTKKEVVRIMKKETMSKCHVVLTSRCGHVPDDVKSHALPVRVTGFGRRQVAVAVGKFFVKAGHLTKAEVTSYRDKPVPPRESDSKNKTDDLDYHALLLGIPRVKTRESDNKLDDSITNLDDSILPIIDDFKHVQEMEKLLPEDERLSLVQFNEFMGKLRAESPYKELAQCPLLCVMLCCLVSDCPNGKLPSTVSGLYFAMINRNIYRAERKKAPENFRELSILQNRIATGHEGYLQDFGRLCINGLKTKSLSFTFSDITGNEAGKTSDVKVTQLIEAGVLVQDTNERNLRYQVPHRTTAEFLAAYCLGRETDQNLCQQILRDLCRLDSSFHEVAASLIEMGKTRCLAEAFCDIKFPYDCLTRFLRSYFFANGAARTWEEFKDALPNCLQVANTSGKVTVRSDELQILLHLCERLCKGNTEETNARPSDFPFAVGVEGDFNPELWQTLSKSGIRLSALNLFGKFKTSKSVGEEYTISEAARMLQELLKSHSCPVQLSFRSISEDLIRALTEAMQEVPEGCRLKSFHFSYLGDGDPSLLLEVLAEKWLSHLQYLGLERCNLKPILKRLREPGCSLTLLSLDSCKIDIEDLMMLASKLDTLWLKRVDLYFHVTEISKYAVKERCSLKSLELISVNLFLTGSLPSVDKNQELLLAWRNVALHLEELEIENCEFPIELFSWLNLSLPNLRTVTIHRIHGKTPNGDRQFYANQVLEALTRSSGDSIEELSLLKYFWEDENELMLHPVREALQRCPRMKSVNLGYYRSKNEAVPIGPGPSTPLSPNNKEALKSDNNYYALLQIVLSVPKLQTFISWYFFDKWEEIGTFHAIAEKAEKWPGKTNGKDCKTSLTLSGLSNENAANAMHVFRERGLEYRFRRVDEYEYEFWFPPV